MSRVLIAEDEPALLEVYSEVISGLGHACFPARDGLEALEVARSCQPDLVVADYMMPGRNGVELIRALRADPVLGKVPTILLSAGRPSEADRREAGRFLAKPVSLESLERCITEALRSAALPPRPVVDPPEDLAPVALAREQMLSWVAHEIKSPLAGAMAAAQVAIRTVRADAPDPASLERRLLLITRQLSRMDELVNSVLDAAQLQDGRLRLELEEVELGALLRAVLAFWQDLHPDFEFRLDDGAAVVVQADRERLRQVMDNLISNGIKYGGAARLLRITASHDDGAARVAVQDEGPGIPAEEIPHIFDRFHRVPGQVGRGHGLGLYIASALVRRHGGLLSVESELGRGSTFTVTLPRDAEG